MKLRNRKAPRALPTREQYDAAFQAERAREYPAVDAFEREYGYAVDRARLEDAARALACPVKPHPPNWQHGRILYALARDYLNDHDGKMRFLDIGTAKGFSALVMAWAVKDSGRKVRITSCDVLEPKQPMYRNSVADLDGPKTLAEYLAPWPEAAVVGFWGIKAADWLRRSEGRVHLAFVDGKHSTEAVIEEAELLAARQIKDDLVLFDDLQMLPVRKAFGRIEGYDRQEIRASRERVYGLAIRA